MKHIVEAQVPTHHKLNAIRKFGMPTILNADGSISAKEVFNDRDRAIKHLLSVADTEQQVYDINNYGYMEYDNVTAYTRPANLLDRMKGEYLNELTEKIAVKYPHTYAEIIEELRSNYWLDNIDFRIAIRIYGELKLDNIYELYTIFI